MNLPRGNTLWFLPIIVLSLSFISCNDDDVYGPPEQNKVEELPEEEGTEIPTLAYERGAEGYAYYRIPTMVISNNGTVLAFAEGRVNGREDQGDIDIVLKRSTDKGLTWSENIIIKDDGVNRCQNPVPVLIPETGRILLLTSWNLGATGDRRVFVTYSDDDGLTWAEETDITSQIKNPDWNQWYATGPVHGTVKQFSPHKGRILVPTNHMEGTKHYSQIIYSDDMGQTWNQGAKSPVESNESTVVELSSGEVMLNMRNPPNSENRTRIVALSQDGGESFYEHYFDAQLPEPISQASLIFHSLNSETGKGNLLFSNPPGTSNRRGNVIRLSEDDGETWSKKLQYVAEDETGGYSDLAVFENGEIAILYELGHLNDIGIGFKVIQLQDLK